QLVNSTGKAESARVLMAVRASGPGLAPITNRASLRVLPYDEAERFRAHNIVEAVFIKPLAQPLQPQANLGGIVGGPGDVRCFVLATELEFCSACGETHIAKQALDRRKILVR